MNATMRGGMIYIVQSYRRSKSGLLLLTDEEMVENLVPVEGLNHMLATEFKGGAQVSNWYLALFEGNYTPVSTDTAADFAADATECVAYTQATRVLWNAGTPAGGVLDNTGSVAIFDMNATVTVYGAALLSAPSKGATTGVLSSIARFAAPKSGQDQIKVTAGYVLTST